MLFSKIYFLRFIKTSHSFIHSSVMEEICLGFFFYFSGLVISFEILPPVKFRRQYTFQNDITSSLLQKRVLWRESSWEVSPVISIYLGIRAQLWWMSQEKDWGNLHSFQRRARPLSDTLREHTQPQVDLHINVIHWLSGIGKESGTGAKNLMSYWQKALTAKNNGISLLCIVQTIQLPCKTLFQRSTVLKEKCVQKTWTLFPVYHEKYIAYWLNSYRDLHLATYFLTAFWCIISTTFSIFFNKTLVN